MTKKPKTKPQMLAEVLGTTSEEAKQFGDLVNQYLSRNGHQVVSFEKMCGVIRANPECKGNARAVAEALGIKAPLPDSTGAGASSISSTARHVSVDGQSLSSGPGRFRLSEMNESEAAQIKRILSARVQEAEKADVHEAPSVKGPKPAEAQALAQSSDEAKIRQFVADREIKYLVHLTTMDNLRGICEERAILSVNELKQRALAYEAFDTRRYDGHLDYINCSIGYYNFHMFYPQVSMQGTHDVLLLIRPDYLWKPKTLFSPVNAATRKGYYVRSGYEALLSLYRERVDDNVGTQVRDRKPGWMPTSIQAEVLVYQRIPIEDILHVLVPDQKRVNKATEAGWTSEVMIRPNLFEYRDRYISRTHSPSNTDDDLFVL